MPPLAPAIVSTGSPGAACTSAKLSTTTAAMSSNACSRRLAIKRRAFMAAAYLNQTSSSGDAGPQIVVGTFATFFRLTV